MPLRDLGEGEVFGEAVFMGGSDVNPSIVDVPLHQQEPEGNEDEPFPQLARLVAVAALAVDGDGADLDTRARLDVAFLGVEQVDGKAALPRAIPEDAVGTHAVSVTIRKIGPRATADGLGTTARVLDLHLVDGKIGPQHLGLAGL